MAVELRPEVVLCDIGLPDVNGYEVARRLRADQFDAHLTKPPDLDKLNKLLVKEVMWNAPPPQSVP